MSQSAPTYETRACSPTAEDERREPTRCVIAHHVQKQHPWAKHVSVGVRTIRVYDYRCEHNPDGLLGGCDQCLGRALVWSTPMTAAAAIKEFDRGGDPSFPAFVLRVDEAAVMVATQDRARKREAMAKYRNEVRSGERKPNRRSARAKARAKSNRRKG